MSRVPRTRRPYPSEIAFTPAVKQLQRGKGSRARDAHLEADRGWMTRVTPELETVVAGLDLGSLGMANSEGQPDIRYRCDPPAS